MKRPRACAPEPDHGTIRRPSESARTGEAASQAGPSSNAVASDRLAREMHLTGEANQPPDMIARLEAALLLLATLMELDGDIHVPVFERLEAELASRRRVEDARDRARRLLADYNRSGERSAICSRNLSLSSSEGPRPYLGL